MPNHMVKEQEDQSVSHITLRNRLIFQSPKKWLSVCGTVQIQKQARLVTVTSMCARRELGELDY